VKYPLSLLIITIRIVDNKAFGIDSLCEISILLLVRTANIFDVHIRLIYWLNDFSDFWQFSSLKFS
jgi:hypothetical protein